MTGRQDDRQEYDRQRTLDKYMIDTAKGHKKIISGIRISANKNKIFTATLKGHFLGTDN